MNTIQKMQSLNAYAFAILPNLFQEALAHTSHTGGAGICWFGKKTSVHLQHRFRILLVVLFAISVCSAEDEAPERKRPRRPRRIFFSEVMLTRTIQPWWFFDNPAFSQNSTLSASANPPHALSHSIPTTEAILPPHTKESAQHN